MASKKTIGWVIIIVLLTLVAGFILGNYFSSKTLGRRLFLSSGNKINVILDVIDEEYVDSVNMKDLVEEAIPKLISELDPHSAYIPADKLKAANEDLEGHFGGIGVGFVVQDDTIMVVSVVSGGPSEQAGIQAGDRLVTIGDSLFAGVGIKTEQIISTLRGATGSKIKLGIKRNNSDKIIHYEIIRGEIPDKTVETAYEISKGIGYIKVKKFARTTYDEFVQALAQLMDAGCQSFILDLRSNTGGILEVSINMANEFLSRGQLIVYRQGRASPRNDAIANGAGTCQENQITLLMDEISASASEVMAGAIQDNDRGLIIGRRSYGKGLVQNPITFSDGSALRLTIARYYTPSGRCIQRNYQLGKSDAYEQEWIDRFSHGESFSKDSIKQDESLKYKTAAGRTVYGGGGIMPDIFVPRDTSGITSYYINLENNDIFYRYAFKYVDQRRKQMKQFKNYESLYSYLKKQPILEEVVRFADANGIRPRTNLIHVSAQLIENRTIAYIVGNAFGNESLYAVVMKDDPVVLKAVDVIKKGEAKPEFIRKNIPADTTQTK